MIHRSNTSPKATKSILNTTTMLNDTNIKPTKINATQVNFEACLCIPQGVFMKVTKENNPQAGKVKARNEN